MNRRDKLLGLDRSITRRDFLGSTLVGAGSLLLSGLNPAELRAAERRAEKFDPWTGYGGVGDYADSNGNTRAVIDAAHLIRDKQVPGLLESARPTGEAFDLVVIGGGFAGLGAAFQFHQATESKSCLVLDNHPVFGGEAKQNEFQVGPHRLYGPQGSNAFMPPTGRDMPSDDVWRAVGLPTEFAFADEAEDFGIETPHDSYEAMFWGERRFDVGHAFGSAEGVRWEKNIWSDDLERTPWSSELRESMRRAVFGRETPHPKEGLGPWLDRMTYKAYLEEVLGLHPGVTDYVDPILAISNYGFGSDVISAYGAYLLAMPGLRGYFPADSAFASNTKFMSFPGGNTTYARYIVKHLVPGAIPGKSFEDVALGPIDFGALDKPGNSTRIRLAATAVDARHAGDGVRVTYVRNGTAQSVTAKSVVVAAGGWVGRNIVADMPESIRSAYEGFHHGPVLVVNVALNNWRFLERLGVAAARWYDGFGFFGSIRAPMKVGNQQAPWNPGEPVVMTFYVPFYSPGHDIRTQGTLGRAALLGKSYRDYEREIREQLNSLFGAAGFDAARDIEGIVLNRWGHAYVSPQPGFYFGGAGGEGLSAAIKQGHDRIFYGHSELGSRMNYRNAIAEGGRAGEQAAKRV